jgi:YD repeat-containing protein
MLNWIRLLMAALSLPFGYSTIAAQVLQPSGLAKTAQEAKVTDGDPFDLSTGIYYREYKDLFVKDTIPIDFVRTQRNMDPRSRSFGIGGSTSYDMFIIGDVEKFSWVALVLADGGHVKYSRISPGTSYADGVFEDKDDASEFFDSKISWNGHGGWTVKLHDGREYTVQGCSPATTKPGQCAVTEVKNASGERLTIQRDPSGNIVRITSPHGHFIDIKTDAAGRISHTQDDSGRWLDYYYDKQGCLTGSVSWRHDIQQFRYDSRFNMTWVHEKGPYGHDGLGPYDFTISNQYGADDRVVSQQVSNGDSYSAAYHTDAQGRIRQTDVKDNHSLARYFFDETGYVIREDYYRGKLPAWTLKHRFEPQTHRRLGATLSCGARKIDLPAEFAVKMGTLGESHKPFVSEMCHQSAMAKSSSHRKN